MLIATNILTYLEIARDSLTESDRLLAAHSNLIKDGLRDWVTVKSLDPRQQSFKHALIAIVFAGAYLEGLLHIEGCKRLGRMAYDKIDRKPYENKLTALGIDEPELIAAVIRFRQLRRDLLHEQSVKEAGAQEKRIWTAQSEARKAIELIVTIAKRFSSPSKGRARGSR